MRNPLGPSIFQVAPASYVTDQCSDRDSSKEPCWLGRHRSYERLRGEAEQARDVRSNCQIDCAVVLQGETTALRTEEYRCNCRQSEPERKTCLRQTEEAA